VDWKTGSHISAQDNAQLVHLASALMLLPMSTLYAVNTHIVKLDEYGYSIDSSVVTREDVDAHVAWLMSITAREYDDTPQPGMHCRFCHALNQCGGEHLPMSEHEIERELMRLYALRPRKPIDTSSYHERISTRMECDYQMMEVLSAELTPYEIAMCCRPHWDTVRARKMIGKERAEHIQRKLWEVSKC
jgi:hypothetical protein